MQLVHSLSRSDYISNLAKKDLCVITPDTVRVRPGFPASDRTVRNKT